MRREDRRPSQGRPRRDSGAPSDRRGADSRTSWRDRRPDGDRPPRDDRAQGRPSGDRPQWEGRRSSGARPERRGGDRPRSDWRERRPSGDRTARERSPQPALPAGPELPDWADPRELDQTVRSALRGLEPRNAERVARHLVAAGTLVDDDPEAALSHARAARDRASRVAAVREAVGVAAYHAGDYAEAARELRAYRRMSGDEGYRAVLADCERALGRPEVALRLVAEALAGSPTPEELVELRLVEAGVRRELGEPAAALLVLEDALGGNRGPERLTAEEPGRLRLAAAYADLLRAQGDVARADSWAEAVAAADEDDVTGTGGGPDVVFSEEPMADEPDPVEEGVGTAPIPDDEELDFDEDVEAEVAELLGEDHPLARPGTDPGSSDA